MKQKFQLGFGYIDTELQGRSYGQISPGNATILAPQYMPAFLWGILMVMEKRAE